MSADNSGPLMPKLYYVVDVGFMRRGGDCLSFWRPNCMGYTVRLLEAGKYTQEEIINGAEYFNNPDTKAFPCEIVDKFATPVVPSMDWQKVLEACR